jgi:hypothetical protein
MAGLSPFQFSSNKLQNMNSISSETDPTKKSLLSDTYQSVASWYEMWINPTSVTITDSFIQQTEHTAGAIVTYHYRKDLAIMEVKGIAGWVMIQSDLDAMKDAAMSALRHPLSKDNWKNAKKNVSKAFGDAKSSFKDNLNPFNNNSGPTNKLNNSPRKFLERLRDLAYEPTYYFDSKGREHYNAKYIKMYTKQYPRGIICEGFFKNFIIPETAEDVQTINYTFTFVIQDMQVVTLIQQIGGMFSPVGSLAGAGVGLF